MAKIPESLHEHKTSTAIIKWHEKVAYQGRRPHLGCSELGKECDRAIWYGFRWALTKKFDGRMLRLFNRGHREEPQFLEELRGIGIEVYDKDPDTNQQHRFVGYKGHLQGSCDAIGRGFPEAPKTWAIAEFKTHGDKSFKELVAKTVIDAKPEHYAQMILYMGFAELDRSLYLAVNKNTDELYSEWVYFDKEAFDALLHRAKTIIDADEPLTGISADPAWYQCKMCDYQSICHGENVPDKNCRTCVHASPVDNGQWHCANQDRDMPIAEQRLGCRSHLFIPPLITYAEPVDAGNDWIKYKDRDSGIVFANVTEDADRSEANIPSPITACFTSAELVVASRGIVNDAFVAQIKQEFTGSRVVGSKEDSEAPF